VTTTKKDRGNRPYRSYEELQRELMPKQAEIDRPINDGNELRDRFLEILRDTAADISRDGAA
jgi:hypothetical protein